ncbi:MAG TPA: PKD domain-containing protein [Candidatus Bipolaricaulota bacterium]
MSARMILAISWLALVAAVAGCDLAPSVRPATLSDPPFAAFSFSPVEPELGQAVEFRAVEEPTLTDFSRPAAFDWDFGDGAVADGPLVSHAFGQAGAFRVTLTTTSDQGLRSTTAQTVRVQAPRPAEPQFPYTFGSGLYLVGEDIEPGTYRTRSPGNECFWERLKGVDGTQDAIIAREYNDGPAVVQIKGRDGAFRSQGCARWTKDLSPVTAHPDAPFGQGVFIVGTDISPGIWVSEDTGRCYWTRLAGFSWEPEDVLADGFERNTPVAVLVEDGDAGFASSECGAWTKFQVRE